MAVELATPTETVRVPVSSVFGEMLGQWAADKPVTETRKVLKELAVHAYKSGSGSNPDMLARSETLRDLDRSLDQTAQLEGHIKALRRQIQKARTQQGMKQDIPVPVSEIESQIAALQAQIAEQKHHALQPITGHDFRWVGDEYLEEMIDKLDPSLMDLTLKTRPVGMEDAVPLPVQTDHGPAPISTPSETSVPSEDLAIAAVSEMTNPSILPDRTPAENIPLKIQPEPRPGLISRIRRLLTPGMKSSASSPPAERINGQGYSLRPNFNGAKSPEGIRYRRKPNDEQKGE